MSSILSAELAATCNALGYFDEKTNKYYADGNTLETVKDLIRYLRRDDESHDIRRHLGDTKVLQTDLLPLLKHYWEEIDLFDVLLRLLVNLTSPPLMLWNEELPSDKNVRNHYLQIEDHLQNYKQAFADEAVWAVLSTRLSKILEIEYSERGDENSLIIERILILIRNILHIPPDPSAEKRADNDASVHDQVLWALHQSGMLDIILYITCTNTEQAYYMHTLEILSFLLREQKASELASAALQRNQTEKIRDEAELLAIRHRETIQRQHKPKATRHSRFGGTYVVKSMKSISDNELIYHKPLKHLDSLNFDADKKKAKTPKNRVPLQSGTSERRSAFSIRLFLKEFCVEFLNGAYNTLMYHAKDNLVRGKVQQHDESYYLIAMRFFMEFNRCYKFQVKLVSETMSVQSFHYVQQQMENYFDMMQSDKKKLKLWSRRLHLALLAYRELLLTILAMDKSPDGTVKDSAKVIKSNVFYVLEYREFILTLLVMYDELKMSDVYLCDLIETQHIFLKMFEGFCASGTVMVQKKKVKKGKKKASAPAPVIPELNLERQWDEEASPQLSSVLDGNIDFTTDVVPFDAASDVPIDDQKTEAMLNIQRNLRNANFENAIGLLRAAREVWPENDSFGSSNMSPEEEFLALKDIFFADLGENNPAPTEQTNENFQANDEDDYDDEEEDPIDYTETDLKFEDFSKRLANPKIVRACGLALKNFEKNSANTNHCIIKLLHRIAFDLKMFVMVFQVSIFITFQRICSLRELPQYKELAKFAVYILRQFFKLTEVNKKIYMEALFWKNNKEAYDVEQGYGTYHEKSSAANKAWSEEDEDELRRLFMEHRENQLTDDVVDWITNNVINNTRTRRAVLKKLKELCLLTDYKGAGKSGVSARAPQQWGPEEEDQLRELFEHFKDAMDPLTCIVDRLDVKRPKNRIVEKLLVMGLIQDRKEVAKKRVKQSRGSHAAHNSSDDENSDSEVRGSEMSQPQKNVRKSSSKRKRISKGPQITPSALAKLVLNFVDQGMLDELEWLTESFSDALEDFDDGNTEGIPLVPIMDYAINAMENIDFQKLLKAFSVAEPFDEQETYWRIPADISRTTLASYKEVLTKAIEGTLVIPDDEPESAEIPVNDESSDDDDVFANLRKITNYNANRSQENTSIGNNETRSENVEENFLDENKITSDNKSDDDNNQNFGNTSTNSKKKYTIGSDEDSEDTTQATEKFTNLSQKKKNKSIKNKKYTLDSGSDSNSADKNYFYEEIASHSSKKENTSSRKKKYTLDSDDDDYNADTNETKEKTPNQSSKKENTSITKKKYTIDNDNEDYNEESNEFGNKTPNQSLKKENTSIAKKKYTINTNNDISNEETNESKEKTPNQSLKKDNKSITKKKYSLDSDSDDYIADANESKEIRSKETKTGITKKKYSLDTESEGVINSTDDSNEKIPKDSTRQEKTTTKNTKYTLDSDSENDTAIINDSKAKTDGNSSHNKNTTTRNNKKYTLDSDSDDDIIEKINEPKRKQKTLNDSLNQENKGKKKKQTILDSDSSDNENNEIEKKNHAINEKINETDEIKRLRSLSDSDGEKPVSKRSRVLIDSDTD